MKYISTLLSVFVAIALTSTPSPGKEKVIQDADGYKWTVDTETAATPGAGSGLGALIGAVDDSLASFEKQKFDLQFDLLFSGQAGDDSAGTEQMVLGVAAFYRPERWIRFGPDIQWSSGDRKMISLGLPIGFLLNPNPWAKYRIWTNVEVLPRFTVRTDETGKPRDSAWSWVPSLSFSGEVPMGGYSIEGGLGVGYPFAVEGVTDEQVNAAVQKVLFATEVKFNLRLGR